MFTGGDHDMRAPSVGQHNVVVPVAKAGETVCVVLNIKAPSKPGDYISDYRLSTPNGTLFGPTFWIDITVPDAPQPLPLPDRDALAPPHSSEAATTTSSSNNSMIYPVLTTRSSEGTVTPAHARSEVDESEDPSFTDGPPSVVSCDSFGSSAGSQRSIVSVAPSYTSSVVARETYNQQQEGSTGFVLVDKDESNNDAATLSNPHEKLPRTVTVSPVPPAHPFHEQLTQIHEMVSKSVCIPFLFITVDDIKQVCIVSRV